MRRKPRSMLLVLLIKLENKNEKCIKAGMLPSLIPILEFVFT